MAANSGTSFRQYEFCALCKMCHKKRKKHIYSKHHQEILKNIIRKFSSKIQAIKQNLFSPKVEDDNFEVGAKFWCYFCKSEYLKHDVLEMCTIIGAGVLEHIASEDHKVNMTQFFWDNLLDKKLKPKFILSQEDLLIAKKSSFLAMKKFQKSKDIQRKQMAEKMKMEETERQLSVRQSQSDLPTSATQILDLPGHQGTDYPSPAHRRTVWAQGPGLTSIIKIKGDHEAEGEEADGNVHTGATPPWLIPDTSSNSSKQIGPTMEDYQKHLERERKAKLPSTRVGANFDHKSTVSQDWLPSFGRVWSKGRRLQSKIHFQKEWKGLKPTKPRASATVTSEFDTSSHARTQSVKATDPNIQGNVWPCSVNKTSSSVTPYKRRLESSDQQSRSDLVSNPSVVPYKRKRDNVDNNRHSQLLQTPLLADKEF